MKNYLDLLREIVNTGEYRNDRTGIGTKSVFGRQLRFDLRQGFPLLTNKFTSFRLIATELLWFLSGSLSAKPLQEMGNYIWDEWIKDHKTGYLGPIYGNQWRSWQTFQWSKLEEEYIEGKSIDQIAKVIEEIKKNPTSRRLIVSAWNVADLPEMALEPCHVLFQFYISYPNPPTILDGITHGTTDARGKGVLNCQLYQRSGDMFLGVPFNIASYALLMHMVAQVCSLDVGEFILTLGDAHIYLNHSAQVDKLLELPEYPLPSLELDPSIMSIDDFKLEDLRLKNYQHGPKIDAPVAV